MTGMQYVITLPGDYDMDIIRKRVEENGNKTDGFPGLKYKCYLIREKGMDGFEQAYAPLYLWDQEEGMNQFLFGNNRQYLSGIIFKQCSPENQADDGTDRGSHWSGMHL